MYSDSFVARWLTYYQVEAEEIVCILALVMKNSLSQKKKREEACCRHYNTTIYHSKMEGSQICCKINVIGFDKFRGKIY
jgi:hypothetical protein